MTDAFLSGIGIGMGLTLLIEHFLFPSIARRIDHWLARHPRAAVRLDRLVRAVDVERYAVELVHRLSRRVSLARTPRGR